MNRDMYYGNYQAGGFSEPNFMQGAPMMSPQPMMGQPQGYNMSGSYMSYGPNVIPGNVNSNMNSQNSYNAYNDDYDNRITKLERQIRRIDQRLRKLENSGLTLEEDLNDYTNVHMI